jgi:hypothetical protein
MDTKPKNGQTGRPEQPRNFRGLLPNLHDPNMDTVGRVDVLVARGLKMAVARSKDPVLQVIYGQFQPILDAMIFDVCRKANRSRVLVAFRKSRREMETVREKRQRRGNGK